MVGGLLGHNCPSHLRAQDVLEQSISFRLQGDYETSESVIHDMLYPCGNRKDTCFSDIFEQLQLHSTEEKQYNAVAGLLHRSHLENLIQRGLYSLAKSQMYDWSPLDHVFTMEASVLPLRALTICKIFAHLATTWLHSKPSKFVSETGEIRTTIRLSAS
jgi:hypothetical protein